MLIKSIKPNSFYTTKQVLKSTYTLKINYDF